MPGLIWRWYFRGSRALFVVVFFVWYLFLIYLQNTLALCFFLCHNCLCVYFYLWINIFRFHCWFFLAFCDCVTLLLLFVWFFCPVTFVALLLMLEVYLHNYSWLCFFLCVFLLFSGEIMLVLLLLFLPLSCIAVVIACRLLALLVITVLILPSFDIMQIHWQWLRFFDVWFCNVPPFWGCNYCFSCVCDLVSAS